VIKIKINKILGVIGGILALMLAFVGEIPLSSDQNTVLSFKLFSMGGIDFFYWGFLYENYAFTHITRQFPLNLPAFLIWVAILSTGVSMIMASTKKATDENSLRLYLLGLTLLVILLIFYGLNILTSFLYEFKLGYEIIGLGYYLTIGVFILDLIAFMKLKGESMIDISDLFSV
jgi:hypothetical protein